MPRIFAFHIFLWIILLDLLNISTKFSFSLLIGLSNTHIRKIKWNSYMCINNDDSDVVAYWITLLYNRYVLSINWLDINLQPVHVLNGIFPDATILWNIILSCKMVWLWWGEKHLIKINITIFHMSEKFLSGTINPKQTKKKNHTWQKGVNDPRIFYWRSYGNKKPTIILAHFLNKTFKSKFINW